MKSQNFMLREGGGAEKTDRIWHLVKASETQGDAVAELEEKVKANMRGYRQYALSLSELPVPIHALLEVAERTKTTVFLAAVFEDLESTLSEQEDVQGASVEFRLMVVVRGSNLEKATGKDGHPLHTGEDSDREEES